MEDKYLNNKSLNTWRFFNMIHTKESKDSYNQIHVLERRHQTWKLGQVTVKKWEMHSDSDIRYPTHTRYSNKNLFLAFWRRKKIVCCFCFLFKKVQLMYTELIRRKMRRSKCWKMTLFINEYCFHLVSVVIIFSVVD